MTDTWDPRQYDKFEREREQPFFDLLALVRPAPDMRVVDLGCGTGKLTRALHERLDARETVGIDRSDNMLAGAREGQPPAGLRFETASIEDFAGARRLPLDTSRAGPLDGARDRQPSGGDVARRLQPSGGDVARRLQPSGGDVARRLQPSGGDGWDLIFSNAALHWVDNHERLLEQLAATLERAGQLAFQVPAQHDTLTHLLADELAATEPYRSAFAGWRRSQPVLAPDAYARLLHRFGFVEQKTQLIVYPHILASREDVVEWVKGTMLTEYKRHLPAAVYDQFVDAYRERLLERLEDPRPFFYPFKRILCWGQRA